MKRYLCSKLDVTIESMNWACIVVSNCVFVGERATLAVQRASIGPIFLLRFRVLVCRYCAFTHERFRTIEAMSAMNVLSWPRSVTGFAQLKPVWSLSFAS